jgi:hypothetical protein
MWHAVDPADDGAKTVCGIPEKKRERTVSSTKAGTIRDVSCQRCLGALTP